jgi:lipoprotein-releasing system permease protein
MLGVATLIVVNSVMGGFSTKLRERLHGLLSDVLVEARSFDGFPLPEVQMHRIRNSPVGDKIEAMTPTLEVPAMLQFRYRGELITRPVRLIGVDPVGRSRVGGFAEHLLRQRNHPVPSFEPSREARERYELLHPPMLPPPDLGQAAPGEPPPPEPPPSQPRVPKGIIIGNAIASYRDRNATAESPAQDIYVLEQGDEVIVTTVSGAKLAPVYDGFIVSDFFKSEMSEYDSNYVFVPLDHLQRLRAMEDRVTSIQIRLKNYSDAREVVKALKEVFPPSVYQVETWEDKQGPLLAAISVEKGILNVLLFLIIAVAGFGILAIFSMIVVEKTRDIGILKALGASNAGVLKIFLGYGLLLGVVGAAFGTALGLALTINLNLVEKSLARLTGQDIFPRTVYYFDEIPTDIQFWSVALVNVGAVVIAVVFSVLPALRAALLHPVRALRYE